MRLYATMMSAAALVVCSSARATLIAYEPFDIPGTAIVGQGSGFGWTGDWAHQITGQASVDTQIQFSNLAQSGGALRLTGPYFNANEHSIRRTLNIDLVGDTLWTSYLYMPRYLMGDGTVMNTTRYGYTNTAVEFYDAANTVQNFGIRAKHNVGFPTTSPRDSRIGVGDTFAVITDEDADPDHVHTNGTMYLILAKLTGLSGESQTATIWGLSAANFDTLVAANWDESVLADSANYVMSGSVTGTTTIANDGVLRIRYREAGQSYFDELRIGTTLASVTPIPEPTAALLAGLTGAGFLLRRGRRD